MDFNKNWKSVLTENQKINEETDQRIWNNIESKISINRHFRKIYWAAAVLVPFFGFLIYKNFSVADKTSNEILFVETQNYSKTYRLSDGSIVKMKPFSKLVLDKNFGEKERLVSFEGNAYFDIAKDKKKPFRINAKEFSVQVLGTKFFLNQNPKSKKVELIEGKVEIDNKGKKTFLLPMESWVLDVNEKEHHYYNTSVTKTFAFNHQNYSEVIKELEETYNVTIEYPIKYQNQKINGSFTGNLNEILSIVSFPFNLKIYKTNEKQIILK